MDRRWLAAAGVSLLLLVGLCLGLRPGEFKNIEVRHVESAPAEVRRTPSRPLPVDPDGPFLLPSPLTPGEEEERFEAWREDFLVRVGELGRFCGGEAEVTCDDSACVVRVDPSEMAWIDRYIRRPQRLVEQFAVHRLGLPEVLDRCGTAWKDIQDHSALVSVTDSDPTCFGFFPRIEQPPLPAEGRQMRDGRCTNCEQYPDPGPEHGRRLCGELADQPFH